MSKEITRSDFIKGGILLGGVMAIPGALTACSSESGGQMADTGSAEASTPAEGMLVTIPAVPQWDEEADVVVCGCGTGGAPAAIEAHDAGASVLVIEKMDWIGGCMRRCGGGITGAGTIVQQKLGIDDDVEMFYDYQIACAEQYCDPELIRAWVDVAGENINWIIEDLGGQPLEEWDFSTPEDKGETVIIKPGLNISGTPVYFDDYNMPENRRVRCHWFKPNPDDIDPGDRAYANYDAVNMGEGRGGTGLWKPFENALVERDIPIMLNTSLVHLILNSDREVVGVEVESEGATKYIKAKKGVVIATGAMANNPDLVKAFTGQEWVEPTYERCLTGGWLPEQCDGAGVVAAMEVGAALTDVCLGGIGGIKINPSAQVMDHFGNPIPRLYATSHAVGGFTGEVIPSCGVNVAPIVAFGRFAGQNAAKENSWA